MHETQHNNYGIIKSYFYTVSTKQVSQSCLFGLPVECANARPSTWPGLISCTEPGTNPVQAAHVCHRINILGSQ